MGSQSKEIRLDSVSGAFDVTIAIYEDASFTRVADDQFQVIVPDHVYIGIVLAEGPNLLLQARSCWVTPDSSSSNSVHYTIMDNGCSNTNVSSY